MRTSNLAIVRQVLNMVPRGCGCRRWRSRTRTPGSSIPADVENFLLHNCKVLNLVPWGGVALRLPPVAIADADGWPAVGQGVAAAYIADITTHQVMTTRH